ncbi:glycosyltransferase [Leptolyngbya sp. CCY15150]|uniref:glycosyltransferase n=1 Tax=Leptolyngbya sp. CCY15150 TaxID=2767772 RepID=UPI00194FEBA6|nr:glycosyltransferase [Leptolyngbya sp. CCY15150]
MKINILTIGSRGDVQPYIALGVGLQQAGYTVQLTTHDTFKDLIQHYGLDFWPIGGNVQAIVQGEAGQSMIESGGNSLQALSLLRQALDPILAESLAQTWASCQDADAVISSGTAFFGDDVAECLGLPSFIALLQPLLPTGSITHPMAPPFHLGKTLNRWVYQFFNRFYWQLFKQSVNDWRQRTLHLAPHQECPFLSQRWRSLPKLLGYSPAVIPHPPDWDAHHHITGYWFLDAPPDFTPPADLLAFLDAGDPPISIGFGSMTSRDAETITAIALAALEKTGQRGLLLTGWGGIQNTDLPDHIFKLDAIPHDWLFPRMKAIVHHGGAGTTAATLRSGIPGIVVPFFADQPFWGNRSAQLGVSPQPIPKKRLSIDSLAHAIQQATTDSALRQQAQHLGRTIRAEDGIGQAMQVINATLTTAKIAST